MGNPLRTLTNRIRERGVAAVESLIALPIVVLLMLGAAEWARIYEAKTTLDHATVQGARAGAVDHAQPLAIQRGIAQGMLPFYAPPAGKIAQTQAELTATLGTQSRLRILNPTPEAFDDFGVTENGRRVLPNDSLRQRSTALGANSGLNIQDANLLKVETTWGVELRMPFIAQLIGLIGQSTSTPGSFEHQLYSNGMIPVTATTLVRMQSPAWENNLMVSIADQQGTTRNTGGPVEQLVTDPGTSTPWGGKGGYNGSLVSSYLPDHLGGNPNLPSQPPGHGQTGGGNNSGSGADSSGSDNSDSGGEEEATGPAQPDGPDCVTTWNDPKYQVEKCDSWYCSGIGETFHQLAQGVKVAIHVLGDFIEGLIDGLGDQVADLLEILKDPTVLLDTAKALATDPIGTLKGMVESVVDDVETLLQCGPYDMGRILGQNINPAVALKVVGKLAKLSGNDTLTKYADELEEIIACASFPAGTPIWTPNGPVPIEQLRVGNRVESRSTSGYVQAAQPILQTFNRTAPGYQRIDTEFGTLTATPEHPFWVQGKGWTEAKDLQWEDPIATLDGDVVTYANTYVEEPTRVYNFSVANTPNYFAGEVKAWVHNASCELPTRIDSVKDQKLSDIANPQLKGLVGEAKVNRILSEEHGMTSMGNKNVDYRRVENEGTFTEEFNAYKGSQGIDGIYRGKDGKIYIVESKASGTKDYDSCKAGSLCSTDSGQQMSRDWINEDRLRKAGLEPDEIKEVLQGLEENDGTVVRLYAGTSASGNTKFYEIQDQPGSTSKVKVDRAGNEYQF